MMNDQPTNPWLLFGARAAFAALIFFTFFGTAVPFQERPEDVYEIATSNIVNQLVYSSLFLLSCLVLIPKRNALLAFVLREKFLTLFLLWCVLSTLWSDYPFVTFKRIFQIMTVYTVSMAILLYEENQDAILKIFHRLFTLYIVVVLPAVLLIPAARNPRTGEWRGLSAHENQFSQIVLILILTWFFLLKKPGLRNKVFAAVMLMISTILLIGADSQTSNITLLFMLLLGLLFLFDKFFSRLGIGRFFSMFILLSFVVLIVVLIVFAPDALLSLPAYFGKDITFTGRTNIWVDILREFQKHWLIGCGYNAFWVMHNVQVHLINESYGMLLKSAHNGYLDLLNETGIIGISMILLMIVRYFRQAFSGRQNSHWQWFVIAALVLNLQESSLFRQGIPMGSLFIFSYLTAFIPGDE